MRLPHANIQGRALHVCEDVWAGTCIGVYAAECNHVPPERLDLMDLHVVHSLQRGQQWKLKLSRPLGPLISCSEFPIFV